MGASRRAWVRAAAGAALALGGCASTGTPAPTVAALPETPAAPPVNYGGFLGGPVGQRLPDADRTAALAAETGAIESGPRRSWKGARGVYGYVEPGPASGVGDAAAVPDGSVPAQCRTFTSTVFFAGRPQTGHGTGCQGSDGTWHLTS